MGNRAYDAVWGTALRTTTVAHRIVHRLSGGKLWRRFPGGAQVIWITTLGRRSGEWRTTPLLAVPDDAHERSGVWAVTGSKAGVFLPMSLRPATSAGVIVEGPTDAAACLDLGLYPIGRPSCLGCEEIVIQSARRLAITNLTVVADNDGPGIQGARKLSDALGIAGLRWRLVTAGGHKDMRAWRQTGVTRDTVEATWAQAQWR
jgi:hypothetical protein